MIRIIRTHNKLNGILFSIAEFLIIAGVISPFAVYYILHAHVLYAMISVGIILNCLTVVGFGIHQWINKEQGIGWKGLRDKQERDRMNRENSHLLMDTIILTITALLPYVLIVLVMYDGWTQSKGYKS